MNPTQLVAEITPPLQTVYGSVMNQTVDWQRVGSAMNAPPYGAPPQAPVLYIKPSNTFVPQGRAMALPAPATHLYVTPQMGLVCVSQERWILSLFHEASLEQPNWFRPPVKFNAHDHSLAYCKNGLLLGDLDNLDSLFNRMKLVSSYVRSGLQSEFADNTTSSQSMRISPAKYIAEIGSFIRFEAGDAVMLGASHEPFVVQRGDVIQSELFGFDTSLILNSSVEKS